jgi:ubiquinone/menaquinone biosynthesis C-methylase UbiE
MILIRLCLLQLKTIFMEGLKSFFEGKEIQNVLDIGTGSGEFIKRIAPFFCSETRIVGIDPNEEALKDARNSIDLPNVEFLRMEGEALDFDDQTFDLVCLSNAMHHLASPMKTLSEMRRIVKPGGYLLIAEIISDGLNEAQENQKMLHHFKSFVDRKSGIVHHETWTRKEVIEIIQSNGIQTELAFPFNRMTEPVTDSQKLKTWIDSFEGHLRQLESTSEIELHTPLFELFKERILQHGFQQATQIVVLGKKQV